jgi:hypothetical protein
VDTFAVKEPQQALVPMAYKEPNNNKNNDGHDDDDGMM